MSCHVPPCAIAQAPITPALLSQLLLLSTDLHAGGSVTRTEGELIIAALPGLVRELIARRAADAPRPCNVVHLHG